jgi:hypothetical protein
MDSVERIAAISGCIAVFGPSAPSHFFYEEVAIAISFNVPIHFILDP